MRCEWRGNGMFSMFPFLSGVALSYWREMLMFQYINRFWPIILIFWKQFGFIVEKHYWSTGNRFLQAIIHLFEMNWRKRLRTRTFPVLCKFWTSQMCSWINGQQIQNILSNVDLLKPKGVESYSWTGGTNSTFKTISLRLFTSSTRWAYCIIHLEWCAVLLGNRRHQD